MGGKSTSTGRELSHEYLRTRRSKDCPADLRRYTPSQGPAPASHALIRGHAQALKGKAMCAGAISNVSLRHRAPVKTPTAHGQLSSDTSLFHEHADFDASSDRLGNQLFRTRSQPPRTCSATTVKKPMSSLPHRTVTRNDAYISDSEIAASKQTTWRMPSKMDKLTFIKQPKQTPYYSLNL